MFIILFLQFMFIYQTFMFLYFFPHLPKTIKQSISVIVLFFSFFPIQWREISSLTVDFTSTIFWPVDQYMKITCGTIQENSFCLNSLIDFSFFLFLVPCGFSFGLSHSALLDFIWIKFSNLFSQKVGIALPSVYCLSLTFLSAMFY